MIELTINRLGSLDILKRKLRTTFHGLLSFSAYKLSIGH